MLRLFFERSFYFGQGLNVHATVGEKHKEIVKIAVLLKIV